jgi:anti-sigma factor ChrR (cupin superfamily)
MRKSLYQNSETGASSWLLGVLPHFKDNRYEIHPVMEEGFQINGELDTSRGPFKEGSYFWRPSEIPHGNFNTKRGCLTFFRTDGPLKTTYVEAADLN